MAKNMLDAARALSPSPSRFTAQFRRVLKVEIMRYVSLSESMSLLDELVENERAASDPLVLRPCWLQVAGSFRYAPHPGTCRRQQGEGRACRPRIPPDRCAPPARRKSLK